MKCVSAVIKTACLCDTGYLCAVRDRMKCVSAVTDYKQTCKTDLSVLHWLFECSER